VKSIDRPERDRRKQAVSIRMSRSDVRNIKQLAERLGARDSDVIRFAIKLMLSRLAPLQDPTANGRGLVPVFLEAGAELMRHFELDASRLSSIINDGVEPERRVEPEDIQLLALSGMQRSYLKLRLPVLRRSQASELIGLGANNAQADGHLGPRGSGADTDSSDDSVRRYLLDKYLATSLSSSMSSARSAP
jgi:hypothetical protein